MPLKVETLIPASWFFMDEFEKVKFNWHTYEYACKLFEHIDSSRNKVLEKWKARRTDEQIAEFCAYFAKRMQKSLRKQSEATEEELDDVELTEDEEYIRDYCHGNTHAQNAAILKITIAAYLELLQSCSICPTRCLDELDMRCELFDRMERGGYLS